jgi:tripartite-type tricarboxylate transporter receptor subunit TctC
MSMSLRTCTLTAGLAIAVCCAAASGFSQPGDYPSRTVRIVVPFVPGGGVDTLARMMAEKMQPRLGVALVVENRAGASGTVGGASVLQSPPDGYTVLFSANTHSMAKQVMSKAPYDPLTDFTPIARVGEAPLLAVISPRLPQKTLAEVAAAARQNPERWTAGTPSLGSPGHIATIEFNRLSGANLTITPYRGTAAALTDVAGGHIQLLIDSIVALLPMARTGGVQGLATTTSKRSALAPEIATAAESGMPGLEIIAWYGLWGPAGMPDEIVRRLNAVSAEVTRELAGAGRLANIGVEPVYESPERFARFMATEVARNAQLLKSVNFQPQ